MEFLLKVLPHNLLMRCFIFSQRFDPLFRQLNVYKTPNQVHKKDLELSPQAFH